jgi:hypothetical protein
VNDRTPDYRKPDDHKAEAKPDNKSERDKSPDRMTQDELIAEHGEQYAYLDQTRTAHIPVGGQGDGVPSPMLNPAYYPKNVKPEVLHTEAEKAGADFPEGPVPCEVEDRSVNGQDIEAEHERRTNAATTAAIQR